jgi:hypothetical protein
MEGRFASRPSRGGPNTRAAQAAALVAAKKMRNRFLFFGSLAPQPNTSE